MTPQPTQCLCSDGLENGEDKPHTSFDPFVMQRFLSIISAQQLFVLVRGALSHAAMPWSLVLALAAAGVLRDACDC